jgi:branched-chain amino acid transport system permease protein
MSTTIGIIIQGILLGGLYGTFAVGLSLIFGVMRLVNVAHGDFIVLAAFFAVLLQQWLGISSAFMTLIILIPVMFALGYILQRYLLNPTLGDAILRPILVTFGLSVIIENGLLETLSADSRRLHAGNIENASVSIFGGLAIGLLPLTMFFLCVLVVAGLQWMLNKTRLGRAFRATSDDPGVASLMGINDRHLFAVATGIAFAVIAFSAVFMGIRTSFNPSSGPDLLIFAFEAVTIGGLGSLWGTLLGGVSLGIAQSVGAHISPDWQILSGHLAFLFFLMICPNGMFPKRGD